jgi:hypothetical protein
MLQLSSCLMNCTSIYTYLQITRVNGLNMNPIICSLRLDNVGIHGLLALAACCLSLRTITTNSYHIFL